MAATDPKRSFCCRFLVALEQIRAHLRWRRAEAAAEAAVEVGDVAEAGQVGNVAFDLTFEAVQGSWRLFALSIGLAKTPADWQTVAGTPPNGTTTPSKSGQTGGGKK